MTPKNRLHLPANQRLIVALDVPSVRQAMQMVEELGELVTFYKVGLELLMSGGVDELLRTVTRDKQVFVDLKLPPDIPETIRRAVSVAASSGVAFLTLSSGVPAATIRQAVEGRAGQARPQLLFVPILSSLDRADFAEQTGRDPSQFEAYLGERAAVARAAGVDGFIVSGQEIALLRAQFPDAVLVSPGIRPSGSATQDHKRALTPAEAIHLGADYLVVGRPVRDAPRRRDAARAILDEIAQASEG